jgi:polar amino acid transport system substrate-binding protein
MSRIRLLAALASLLLGVACVPPPDDALEEQIAEDPTMLRIVDRGELRIGIPTEALGIGADPATSGREDSLTTDVAGWVADALGVEPSFGYGTTAEILEAIHDGDLDLAFPVMPMTEGAVRSKKRSYTAPYFVAHQRLLLAPGTTGIHDVAKVCVFGDARTQIPVERIAPDLEGIRSNDGRGCARLAAGGVVEAISAPDVLLFELEAGLDGSKLLEPSYNTEGYGAVVQHGETSLANFVDAVISRAIDDGRWSEAFEARIATLTDLEAEPPDLTAEEAAALFPRGLPVE